MAMVDKTITLDLTSEGIRQTAEVTQGDTGRVLKCNIIGLNLTGITARFIAVKQSKKIIYNNCEISENAVIIKLTEQALAETGITECQIELSKDEEIVQSFVFNLDVKKSLLKSATVSENELGVLDDIQKDIENLKQTKADKNQYGAPLSAKTAAEMTDTSKIYVYYGSEAGYVYGNWYVYTNGAWKAQGEFQAAQIADGSISGEKIADGAITEDKISDRTVTGKKLQYQSVSTDELKDSSVSSKKLQDSSVTSEKIGNQAVTEDKISDNSVTERKIKDGSITSEKMANESVTTEKIADGAIKTKKIADGAVSFDKINEEFRSRIIDNEKDTDALQDAIRLLTNNIELLTKSSNNYANGFRMEDGKLYLTNNGEIISDGITVGTGSGSGGLAFNSGYMSEDGYLHLTQDGTDIEGFDPIFIGTGGGSSSGSKLVFAMYSPAAFSVLQTNGTAPIKFKFSSLDATTQNQTGAGNLSIYVGGILKENKTIEQGDNITLDIFEHLSSGANTVKLTMTDTYGATATRTLTITMESFTLDWNLGDTEKNSGALTIYVTPTGSGVKRIYLMVDGIQQSMQEVTTTGRRIVFNTTLTAGAHEVSVYGTMSLNGVTLTSDTLACAVAQDGGGTVIAAKLTEKKVDQYATLAIPYRVLSSANPATVNFYVNDTLQSTENVDQSEHVWSYRTTEAGTLKLAIECDGKKWEKTIEVSALSSDISEITDSLVLKIDPNKITDLKTVSGLALSENFDTHNGGLQTDSEGIRCIKVVKGDRITLDYKLFGTDARKDGRNFKFIYKVENSSLFDAQAITCMNNNIGLSMKANSMTVKTEQTTLEYPLCEGYKTEAEVNIEPDSENRLMMLWEKGTPAKAAIYASNDNLKQTTPTGITIGSDDCDVIIYMIRVYSRDLTTDEIKANFCADGKDGAEITARHDRNQLYDSSGNLDPDKVATLNPGLHVFTWHAPNVSTAKSQKITGSVTHKYVKGGAAHSWTATNVEQKAQGTSSLGYVQAGCNEDFNFKNGFDLEDGNHVDTYAMTDNSIGVNYLNFKTNVASQEHINNILVSDWYNTYQPYTRPAKQANKKVRDTVEGHMAALFFHNTGNEAVQVGPMTVAPDETVFYSLGNINNSKKNLDVFAQNETDDVIVIEVANNTSDQCRMKSADLSTETWDGDTNFEFRHLAESQNEEEAKQLWQDFLTWVVSCNADAATNKTLPSVVTIDGQAFSVDSKEYRIAKFRKEAADHMIVDSVMWHVLITLVFSQVDNRAKNTFWGYSKASEKWNLCFAYDNDTAMGNDNEGGLTLKYGYMDYDKIGTRDVFNAADATVFRMMWQAFPQELASMYINRENAGAWDLDAFADHCEEIQSLAAESLWIEDVWRKDIKTYTVLGTSAYIPMLNGQKRLQRRQFLHYQRAFMSSYFISPYATAESATIRGYTPTSGNLAITPESKMTITPYSDLWITVKAGSGTTQKRTTAGKAVELQLGVPQMNDTEIYIRNAAFIQDLGDLSCLYPGYTDIASCKKLKRAQIGSSTDGYVNTNMKEVTVKNATSLEYINVENCPALAQELDLSNNINVKECYTRGSGITGVTFAPYQRLQKAKLNAVTSIFAKNLMYVKEFTLQAYNLLTTLNVSGSPALDTLTIAMNAENLTRVRLIDIDWRTTVKAYWTLMRLHEANGIDDDGHNTENGVLTGSVYFDGISPTKYKELTDTIKTVTFTYGQLLEEHTVTFKNWDGTTLNTQKVEHGGAAQDPIQAGYIGTPIKEPDQDNVYTFFKWDVPIENITQDTTVTALFTSQTRAYVVRYLNEGEAIEIHNVKAHGSCIYEGKDLEKSGYVWIGWDKTADDVTQDMDINATYIYPQLPGQIKDLTQYDYAYSDDPKDKSAYTFGEFYSIFKMGKAVEYGFTPAALIKMVPQKAKENEIIPDESIVFRYHSKGHYALSSGTGMTNGDFYMIGVLGIRQQMNKTATNKGGWDKSALREWMNKTLYPMLPPQWRNFIALSDTLASAGNQSTTITTSQDHLRIPSICEVGAELTAVPYKNEVSTEAEEVTFSCYTDNNSRKKCIYNGTGSAWEYWLRSADAGGAVSFRYVYSYGTITSYDATGGYGVCVGFSV